MLPAVRQRRDHLPHRHPRHLRHPRMPGSGRSPAGPQGRRYRRFPLMKRLLAVVLAASMLLVGACSKDAAPAPGTSGAKGTLAFSAWPGWFPWQVAQEQGPVSAHGVDVELQYFDNYLDSLTPPA